MTSLTGLDPATYRSHSLHSPERNYAETNCYTDILIELLHARGLEPLAMLGATVRLDFEGDQWTFFKPPPADVELLYGIDIHECQPYRPLPDQIAEQIEAGRTLIVEMDSWYLPDTLATTYRAEHVKSSIVAEAIDREGRRLRYFHATGLHELGGDDYDGIFRLGRPFSQDVLPPYTELVRFDAGTPPGDVQLREAARGLLREHLARRPAGDPFARFGERLASDLPALLVGDAADYHAYAFATVRMVGSAVEACASHLAWLLGESAGGAIEQMTSIVESSKALSFRLARRRPFDPSPAVEAMSGNWQRALARLDGLLA